jgi:hypothetical protein
MLTRLAMRVSWVTLPVTAATMNLRTYPAKLFLVSILFSMVCSTVTYGQHDVDHDKDDSIKTDKERERDKSVTDVVAGRAIFLESERLFRESHRTTYEIDHPNLLPTTFVNFGPNGDGDRKIQFTNNYAYGSFNVSDLNHSSELYNSLDSFVLSGSFTRDDLDWFKSRKLNFVVWTKYSPKVDGLEATAAAALVSKKFNPSEVSLFDALPSEAGTVRGRLELSRMGLPARPKDWLTARQQIRAAANGISIHTATKPALIKELTEGNATFLLVIAHSDSNYLYLPGVNGGRLSLSELNQIQRQDAPHRVIVLLACKAGDVNNSVASIAEVILKNKLATAVLAASNYVYAADLSSMIAAFVTSGKLGGAFPGLRTIVENRNNLFQGNRALSVTSQNLVFPLVTDEFYC